MLHNKWVEYLKRENESRNFDQIKNYYMQRKLKRFIQIDRKLLKRMQVDKEKEEKERNRKQRNKLPKESQREASKLRKIN